MVLHKEHQGENRRPGIHFMRLAGARISILMQENLPCHSFQNTLSTTVYVELIRKDQVKYFGNHCQVQILISGNEQIAGAIDDSRFFKLVVFILFFLISFNNRINKLILTRKIKHLLME